MIMEKEEDRTITGKIPKSYEKKIEGNKIKIIVKKPKDPNMDIVPVLVKNGKEY